MGADSLALRRPLTRTVHRSVRRPLPALFAGVTAAVVALAFSGGGYGIGVRNPAAIAVWWTIGLGIALGVWPRTPVGRTAKAAVLALGALACLTAASAAWGADAEAAVEETGRVLAYLGLLVLVILAAGAAPIERWVDGLAAGIAVVGLVALASRLFPDLGLADSAARFFEGSVYLSYPLGYWNALAALIALSLPMLLRICLASPSAAARSLAMASMPALVGAMFLTSSRGGMLTAAFALTVFVALNGDRLRAVLAAGVMCAGAAGAIVVLVPRTVLIDGPFNTAAAAAEGRSAALLLVVVCVAAAAAWNALHPLSLRAPQPRPRMVRGLVIAAAVGLAAVFFVADPAARLESFSAPPPNLMAESPEGLSTSGHLLSGTSNGRWQFWQAAVDQFADRPLIGHGAGSYEAWWAQHGTISYFTRQAHSLYLETMGELGFAGLALLALLLAAVAIATARGLRGADRMTVAALGATAAGFCAAAGIDWMWEMPVVAAVGMAAFGLLLAAPASTAFPRNRAPVGRRGLVAVPVALAISVLALPWVAERHIRDSRRAALAGATPAALDAARSAERLAPWAASPRLQHALALEGAGDLMGARARIGQAIDRSPRDWRLHVVQSRILDSSGDEAGARAALDRARALNPRSLLLR